MNVPGRRGWRMGVVIHEGSESRCVVTHLETGARFWSWGGSHERRVEEAQRGIDSRYQVRWDQMAELIAEGDLHGPNVKLVEFAGGDAAST